MAGPADRTGGPGGLTWTPPPACVPFTDGVTRDVFLDENGRHLVLSPDGDRVYGVWVLMDEVLEDAPMVIMGG